MIHPYRLPCLIFGILLFVPLLPARELSPGVYREYSINTRAGRPDGWRVTDPKVVNSGGLVFLPNPVFTFENVDLAGAIRAEITMHHWAGHSDSTGQQFIINGEHRADVPLNPNLDQHVLFPAEKYLNCDNPVIEIPLEWLQEGQNTIEGTFAEEVQGTHWWGQWGWYWIGLRIHCDEATLDIPGGTLRVAAPGKVIGGDTVTLTFEPEDDSINQVDFFAKYYGFDEDGDSIFYDWHGFGDAINALPEGAITRARTAPFTVDWNVTQLPDQQPGAIGFTAVIRRGTNEFRVIEADMGYSLHRDYSIKMFRPSGFPYQLIRNGTTAGATVPIPEKYPITEAASARLLIRTWNGQNNEEGSTPVRINYKEYKWGVVTGKGHYYGLDDDPIDETELISGKNIIWFTSKTVHHGCEILVPGPTLLVRWDHPVPDYLDDRVIMPGWYLTRIGQVYYYPDVPAWQYSQAFEWLYAYAPFAASGWYHSSRLGYVWTASFYPWVYLAREGGWFYVLGTEGSQVRFHDPATGAELLLPAAG